ncbi:MAG: flagellar basal body-associated FliL family protein [Stappiaceae bacterium]
MVADADAPDADELDETPAPAPGKKKKLIMMIGAGVLLLAIGLGAGAYFLGFVGGSAREQAMEQRAIEENRPLPKEAIFYDLPEMLVNLSTGGQATYLKVRVSLEVSDEGAIALIEPVLPRVLDAFQIYLRELRPSDLEGSAGLFRLKEELLRRINQAVFPAHVDGVLFKELLVQ